jgi:hypothetical protein
MAITAWKILSVAANVTPRFKTDRKAGMSREYLAKIRKLPCVVCGTYNSIHAHHLRIKEERGVGMKATDQWAIPLCWEHHLGHYGTHSVGSREENKWFLARGIDAIALAQSLWVARDDEETMAGIVAARWIPIRG